VSGFDRLGVKPPRPIPENLLFNTARRTVTLLVEAGPDARFWSQWVCSSVLVRDQGQGGRAAALAVLDDATRAPDALVVAVLDADLDRVTDTMVDREGLVFTDAHDLETTLVCGDPFDKLVNYYAKEHRTTAEAKWKEPLRQRLLRHGEGMGRLRWLKHASSPTFDALVFKKVTKKGLTYFDGYDKCVASGWAPSLANCVTALCGYSSAQTLLLPKVNLAGLAEALGDADAAQLCNGHDLMGFLAHWLNKEAKVTPQTTSEGLAERLALSCERAWLETTEMWKALRVWEAARPGAELLS